MASGSEACSTSSICPNCTARWSTSRAENVIVCRGECKYRYPVRDDIPVMLIDEAEKPASESGEGS